MGKHKIVMLSYLIELLTILNYVSSNEPLFSGIDFIKF